MFVPLASWYTAKFLDALLSKYDGRFDLLVTAIGLTQESDALVVFFRAHVVTGRHCYLLELWQGSTCDDPRTTRHKT